MNKDRAQKLLDRLTGQEIECLRGLLRHGSAEVRDLKGGESSLKSLEVHKLVLRMGSSVSLTHRGKLVARSA